MQACAPPAGEPWRRKSRNVPLRGVEHGVGEELSVAQAHPVQYFRGDIEGLRAFAMLAILVYHLDPHALTGGFSAVDIFFPISGYLISKQIIEVKQFSFAAFYRRRLRRIFFALVVTVLGAMIAGWRLFTPGDYASLAQSAICSVLAVANVYFYASHSYFDAEASLKPLLHVWSLSVESSSISSGRRCSSAVSGSSCLCAGRCWRSSRRR
ncbi:MAG: acyltransferase family protein [Rhodoplanes sp.]